jgi:hypothetical protein
MAKGVEWRRSEGGVEPTTCTNNTVNFLMSYRRVPAQKQFIAKVQAYANTPSLLHLQQYESVVLKVHYIT